MEGYIYLLKAHKPFDECYKIGYTTNPKQRFKDFGVKLPYPVEVVVLSKVKDCREVESFLHHRHKEKRLDGEWFKLDETEVQHIVQVALTYEALELIERLLAIVESLRLRAKDDFYNPDEIVRITRVVHRAAQRYARRFDKSSYGVE